eukprot:TRINITY_DN44900_c0_g1_i1.p1 TRINITY_DN44900_c0_g1~~TRINITY_DN44900_c0_g1_i1.p1  ORF type:complete len:403 (+),score=59.48 TRINITY_DN44900_c0_g1_i1:1378-2586(+)
MVLPDAMNALRRLLATRPRFLLTHVHTACDNTGWETRIDKHLNYTRYDYNKHPFCLPYPVVEIQRISDDAHFVLYEVTPADVQIKRPATRIDRQSLPSIAGLDLHSFATVAEGELVEPKSEGSSAAGATHGRCADDLGPLPQSHQKSHLTTPVTELPDPSAAEDFAPAERKPIKGFPAVEFRARCDLIFDKFDQDKDSALNFEELVALMDAGGRRIEEYDAFVSLCGRLECDPRMGLGRKAVYKLFEKAPQSVWEEVYRSINPLAQLVLRGASKLPETFLERPVPTFFFEDDGQFAKVTLELNTHLFYGAAEVVTEDHVQAYFGKQRFEAHVVAPGSYGAKDLYVWKLVVSPLSGEVVPEDCSLELKETAGRFGSKKVVLKLMKSKVKKWYKLGQAVTGQRM